MEKVSRRGTQAAALASLLVLPGCFGGGWFGSNSVSLPDFSDNHTVNNDDPDRCRIEFKKAIIIVAQSKLSEKTAENDVWFEGVGRNIKVHRHRPISDPPLEDDDQKQVLKLADTARDVCSMDPSGHDFRDDQQSALTTGNGKITFQFLPAFGI